MKFYSRLRKLGVGSALPFASLLCSFGTENQTFLQNFTGKKLIASSRNEAGLSVATLGKELPGE